MTVANGFGKLVGISTGLQPHDRIIANPSASLNEGLAVEAVTAPPVEP